ncbi:hypothetical protein PsorP6_009361 [Peronosclerospora sorghi]|uniref:Uncharacterized protein n=1 Tax=Peronosclerospora sorghi TaxID=230839 RepID=A0ACC0VZ09_9STRA|nr:hypothetical protein PsorP6_009361 [Peronosclerospora sorghi]
MGCRHSIADDVVGATATSSDTRCSLRDDLTSDLIQHKCVGDVHTVFDFSATIGTGHFGCVKRARSKTSGKGWAFKVVALNTSVDRDALRNEINLLNRLHDPHIVRVIGSYEDKHHMYMSMQLCKGKELAPSLYGKRRAQGYSIGPACDGLFARQLHYAPRLKTRESLSGQRTPASIRLCNFGLSTRFQRGEKLVQTMGTIDYVAPEVLEGDYNEKCNLWSVGVICFELLTGDSPFHASTMDATMANIYDGVLILENDMWSKFSPRAIQFIKSLVKGNVDLRFSAEQALAHEWLTKGEIERTDGSTAARLESNKRMLLTNMLWFGQCRRMKQTALLSVSLGSSEDHVQQDMAAEGFHPMDRTKHGSLSRNEFCTSLVECGIAEQDAREHFDRMNQSKSGSINFLEFLAAVMVQWYIGQRHIGTIKEAFSMLDGER